MDTENILEIRGLRVTFPLEGEKIHAVNGVDLSLKKGESIGIVGESGCGKSVTFSTVIRLIKSPPAVIEGEVILNGRNIMALSEKKMQQVRGKEISMVFQEPMRSLNPVMRIGDQIAESLELHENLNHEQALERAGDMLEMVGIPRARGKEYPHQFSGGMKQRVVIAIALACNPKLLIADEPTTALDVTIQAQVLELMNDLKTKYDTSMIMITHDLGIVAEVCDEVAVMYAGRIIEQGTLEDVFRETMHPYTEGLFNSLPNIKNRTARLKPIMGLMPDPTNLPQGCAFAPRCNYATEECTKKVPELKAVSPTHKCACCAYEREGFCIERRAKK